MNCCALKSSCMYPADAHDWKQAKSDLASFIGCCFARSVSRSRLNGICEQWYDATVGPPCRPAAALTLGMFATWVSTIVAVLVILVKSLLGSKAKRA